MCFYRCCFPVTLQLQVHSDFKCVLFLHYIHSLIIRYVPFAVHCNIVPAFKYATSVLYCHCLRRCCFLASKRKKQRKAYFFFLFFLLLYSSFFSLCYFLFFLLFLFLFLLSF